MIPKCYSSQLCKDYPDTELQPSKQEGAVDAAVCLKDVDILKSQLINLHVPFMFLSKPAKNLSKAIYMYNLEKQQSQQSKSGKNASQNHAEVSQV